MALCKLKNLQAKGCSLPLPLNGEWCTHPPLIGQKISCVLCLINKMIVNSNNKERLKFKVKPEA